MSPGEALSFEVDGRQHMLRRARRMRTGTVRSGCWLLLVVADCFWLLVVVAGCWLLLVVVHFNHGIKR